MNTNPIHGILQQQIVPYFPGLTGDSFFQPGSRHAVFSLMKKIASGRVLVFIADSADRSPEALLLLASIRILASDMADDADRPALLLNRIRERTVDLAVASSPQIFCGYIDTSRRSFSYAHNLSIPPFFRQADDGPCSFLNGDDIGGWCSVSLKGRTAIFRDYTTRYERNDLLLLLNEPAFSLLSADLPSQYRTLLPQLISSDRDRDALKDCMTRLAALAQNDSSACGDVLMLGMRLGHECERLQESGFSVEDNPELLTFVNHDDIEDVCSRVISALDSFGYRPRDRFQIHQSMHELLSNAVRHGNRYAADRKVHVFFKVTQDQAAVSVIDDGPGFSLTDVPDPLAPANIAKSHGKGILLVKKMVDELSYNSRGNRAFIRKYNSRFGADTNGHHAS